MTAPQLARQARLLDRIREFGEVGAGLYELAGRPGTDAYKHAAADMQALRRQGRVVWAGRKMVDGRWRESYCTVDA